MGRPDPGTSGRGPLGSDTNRPRTDHGTTARHRNLSPVERLAGNAPPSGLEIGARKAGYLALARTASYGMQGRSAWQTTVSWEHGVQRWLHDKTGKVPAPAGKPPRVQSFLGGAFLRMYLDGAVDETVVAMAGASIGESVEFIKLSEDLRLHLQGLVKVRHLNDVAPDSLFLMADAFLKARKKGKEGVAFRNTLNTVIGGVTDVEVQSVELKEFKADVDPMQRTYQVSVTFFDTYDFENKRSGEYDRYRKELARLLAANQFDKFDDAFAHEISLDGRQHKTKLDDAAVFASFMYALEKKGWTPGGLKWSVTVPMHLTLAFPAPAKPGNAAPKGAHSGKN